MKKIQYLLIFFIFTAIVLVSSCKFDPSKGIGWSSDISAPIASSEVSIFDFTKDSFLQSGADDLLNIVFRDTVFSVVPSDYVELPDTSIKQAISLGTLKINSDPIIRNITLGYLLRQLMAQGGNAGDVATALYNTPTGDQVFMFPLSGLSSPPYDLDASAFFEYALIKSGDLELKITNKLPVDLKDVAFEVKNKVGGGIIITDTFPNIYKDQVVTELYDMTGKNIESALTGALTNFAINGGSFPMDTNAYIEISLRAVNLEASEATAAFPNQTVVDSIAISEYDFGGRAQISEVRLKYGLIKIDAYSTVQDTIQFLYELQSAYDQNGNHPGIFDKLPPAQGNIPSHKTFYDTLYNVTLDLRNGKLGYNTRLDHIKINLLGSGQLVHFDQSDSLFLYFGLVELQPSYVEGYIGKDTLVFKGEKTLSSFDKFNVDKLFFEDPKLKLTMSNAVGADARIDVKNIRFKNTKNGKQVDLQHNLIQNPQYLLGPRIPNIGAIETMEFNLNKGNSNIQDIISAIPNQISYHTRIIANYSGTPNVRNNFLTDSSYLSAFMDFEMPVHGSIENLLLKDTVNVNFSASVKPENYERVEKGTLKLVLQNQFPFQATVDAVFYDENWNVVQTMANAFVIAAGVPNASGFVQNPAQTIYSKSFDQTQIHDLLQNARHLSLRYRFDSKPANNSVKVYSTYKIKAKLLGDMTYRFGA